MRVLGTGIDIVEVGRLQAAAARRERLLERIFTAGELAAASGRGNRFTRLAARLAAKEAVLKAFGTGLRGVRWQEAEVVSDALGRPLIRLSGRLLALAENLGVTEIHLTMSHSREYAVASVVALGEDASRAPVSARGEDTAHHSPAAGVADLSGRVTAAGVKAPAPGNRSQTERENL